MQSNGYQSYLENEILTAGPLKLVRLLCQGALHAVELARERLRAGDIRGRSQAITRGYMILHELTASLDRSRGDELSETLAYLYDYIERLLLTANRNQAEGPLAEAQQLLSTLLDAWQTCSAAETRLQREAHAEEEYPALTDAG